MKLLRLLLAPVMVMIAGCSSSVPVGSGAAVERPAVSPAAADTVLPRDPSVVVGQLDNGVTYYIRANAEPRQRAALRLVVNAGSVLEDDNQRGLAHFVEHMAFNGTEAFAKNDLVHYLESIGMRFGPELNAYTGFDETVYMLQLPTDDPQTVETGIRILAEWASAMMFEGEEIERERGVVLEEWRQGRGAGARLFDRQAPVLFAGSKYADRLPIGDRQVLETFAHDTLRRFYDTWYRPDLMAVVAVGDIEPETARRLIRDSFGSMSSLAEPSPRSAHPIPSQAGTRFVIATDPEATATTATLFKLMPPERLDRESDYRRRLVGALADAMINQRLGELTRSAEPPFIGAGAGGGRLVRDAQVWSLSMRAREGGLGVGWPALLAEAERVRRHGFTPGELEREKKALLRGIQKAWAERETTRSAAFAGEYVRSFLTGEPFPGIEYELGLYHRFVPGITLEEINQLAADRLEDGSRVVTVSAPAAGAAVLPDETELRAGLEHVRGLALEPWQDRVGATELISSPPTGGRVVSEAEVPELGVVDWRLSNGVRVLVKNTDFKADQVVVTAFSPGGHSLVSDQEHVAAMTAASVVGSGGVGELDFIQLQKYLADKDVQMAPSISELEEGFRGGASPEDLETMFQLMYLYVTAPRRDPTAFAAIEQRWQGYVENRLARPEAELADRVTCLLSNDHFRRRPWSMELLGELDLGTSFGVFVDCFADLGDLTMVIVGAVDLEQLRPLVETYLGSLPSSGRTESWRDIGVEYPTGVVTETVERGLEPKARVELIFTGDAEWSRQTRFQLMALVDVLRIRLREVLREDRGGTYGVALRGGMDRIPRQRFRVTIGFGCDPERVDELVGDVFREIESLAADGVDTTVLAKVQEQHRRQRELDLRDNRFWLGALAQTARRDGDPRQILRFEELVESLTPEAIRKAARSYLPTDNYLRVVLVPEAEASPVDGEPSAAGDG